MQWRRRFDQLKQGDVENTIAWARDALNAGELAIAEQVLGMLDHQPPATAAYHDVAAGIAFAKKDVAGAETHWTEAAKFDPKDDKYRLELAAIRVNSRAPEVHAAALEVL